METIKLIGMDELKAKEKLPKVPELVQQYLDLKKYQPKGKYFRIVIQQKSNPVSGHGIAYSNALRIEKGNDESWSQVYSTGMMEYRGAYASDIDDWDLSLNDPTILEESAKEVVYALRTGEGNVKAYSFNKGEPKQLVSFNTRDYKATQERIGLLQKIIDDAEAFRSYVSSDLEHRWHTASKVNEWAEDCQILADGDAVVLLARHSDRDYDAIVDRYKIYVWVKGEGFGESETYRTGLRHPGGRFYFVGIGFKATLADRGQNFLRLSTEVKNRSQQWSEKRDFRVEWSVKRLDAFAAEVEKAKERVINSHQHNHPLYKPTRVTECVIDQERKIAAWILFEQIDTDRGSEDSEGWLGDQFRYSVWKMEQGKEVEQIFEDHDYIRPRTVSQLTGSRGRDCSLKELRLIDGKISVRNAEGKAIKI